MTAQGSPRTRFVRALEGASAANVLAACAELPRVELVDALAVTLFLAEHEPSLFQRAAVRWASRYMSETVGLDVAEASALLAALAALPDPPGWVALEGFLRTRSGALADVVRSRTACA